MEPPKSKIVIKEKTLFDNSAFAFDRSEKELHSDVMFVIRHPWRDKEKNSSPNKTDEEQDHEIVALGEQMHTREIAESNQTLVAKSNDKGKTLLQGN